KVLSPEQLYDSLAAVAGAERGQGGARRPGMKGPAVGARAQFVAFFSVEDAADPTEYQAGIPQTLRLMNSREFTNSPALQALKAGSSPAQVIERLYLTTLARRPTEAETAKLTAYAQKGDTKAAYGDILWALLNSSEFTLNH